MIHRRKLVQMAAATVWAPAIVRSSRVFAAKPYRLIVAVNLAVNHPVSLRVAEAVAALNQAMPGRLEMRLLTIDQLTPNSDPLTQLRRGTINLLALSGLSLSRLVPAIAICATGFAWRSHHQLWDAMDGTLGMVLRAEIAKGGLIATNRVWDSGFRQITTSTRPIVQAADLKRLKIRVPAHPLWTQMFQALDSIPVVITFTELHSALQSGAVEAQENPLVTINAARLYEVQSHLSRSNHMWDGFWWLADTSAWNSLPEELSAAIIANLDGAGVKQRQDMLLLDQRLLQEFGERGMSINETDTDSFRTRLLAAGFYKDLRSTFPAEIWQLFEKSTGLTV